VSLLLLQRSTSSSQLPKFQTAYEEFDSRLTFDIKRIDESISLKTGESVCIIGERKYTKILLARLCIRALLSKRHDGGGNGFESSNVIVIDARNSLNVYQHVNFARQYGLDIKKKVLQHIIISRVFTVYQLTNIIMYELPKIIEQYDNAKLIVIYELLDMFLRDPQLEVEEGQRLIKEIINSIRRRRETFGNILTATSLSSSPHHNYKHQSSPSSAAAYHRIILPRFDKYIEIITTTKSANNTKKISTSLEGKVKDNSKARLHSKHYYNNKDSSNGCVFPVEERDLLLVTSTLDWL
jgi:hypothetical protein